MVENTIKKLGQCHYTETWVQQKTCDIRQNVEIAFGHLKGRFRRMSDYSLYDHIHICTMMYAAWILHNSCVQYNDDEDSYIEHVNDVHPNLFQNMYQNGHAWTLRHSWLAFFKEIKRTRICC